MPEVGVVGVGITRFGKREDADLKELAFEAFRDALDDVPNLYPSQIQAMFTGYSSGYYPMRNATGAILEYLGLNPIPGFDIHAACASSTMATITGWNFIRSGMFEIVAIMGVQKMSEISGREVQGIMGRGVDPALEAPLGMSMPTAFALRARAYIQRYGATQEDLALVRVKSSEYASRNPHAMFQRKFSVEDVMNSRPISEPLKLLDCCANADGACCLILASQEMARKLTDTPVWIKGVGFATGNQTLRGVQDLTCFQPTVEASRMAYRMAGVDPDRIQVAETHDCFTIAEIMDYEDLGFCPRGQGYQLIREGQTYIGGKIPVNVDGGLLGKGHPIGATGSGQIYSITKWLRGDCVGDIRLDAEIGLAYTRGGIGMYGAAIILSR